MGVWEFGIGGDRQEANFLGLSSKLKFTFAPNASNTLRIVSNLAFFTLFSILEIWAFCTPTSSPNCSWVRLRSRLTCFIAWPSKSIFSSFSKASRLSVPRSPMCLSIIVSSDTVLNLLSITISFCFVVQILSPDFLSFLNLLWRRFLCLF